MAEDIRWEQRFANYKIDLSAFNRISNPDLVSHINRVGKEFYKRK